MILRVLSPETLCKLKHKGMAIVDLDTTITRTVDAKKNAICWLIFVQTAIVHLTLMLVPLEKLDELVALADQYGRYQGNKRDNNFVKMLSQLIAEQMADEFSTEGHKTRANKIRQSHFTSAAVKHVRAQTDEAIQKLPAPPVDEVEEEGGSKDKKKEKK